MNSVLKGAMFAAVIAIGVFGGFKAYEKWGGSIWPSTPANP